MASFVDEYGKELLFGVGFGVVIVFAVAIVERVFGMKKVPKAKKK